MAQEMIKIDFRMDNGTFNFSDALHLPANHTYTEQEIEAMKQARFDAWIAVITAPPQEPQEPVDVIDVTDTSGQ
jgi:hypothetical protein